MWLSIISRRVIVYVRWKCINLEFLNIASLKITVIRYSIISFSITILYNPCTYIEWLAKRI